MRRDETGLEQAAQRAGGVRLLGLDVDGVLTDGGIVYDSGGAETKRFHVRDGLGLALLRRAGVKVAVVTARSSEMVTRRARELGLDYVEQGAGDKAGVFGDILGREGLQWSQAAFLGDDLPDLPVLVRVGLALAVADAAPEVRSRAHLVLGVKGGEGAAREAAELILRAQGRWEGLVAAYTDEKAPDTGG